MSEKARIIVCDDEAPMREMLEEFLTDEGYSVSVAKDGAELRKLVPLVRPDLVICDLKMPGEDGLSLARDLKRLFAAGIDVTDRLNVHTPQFRGESR